MLYKFILKSHIIVNRLSMKILFDFAYNFPKYINSNMEFTIVLFIWLLPILGLIIYLTYLKYEHFKCNKYIHTNTIEGFKISNKLNSLHNKDYNNKSIINKFANNKNKNKKRENMANIDSYEIDGLNTNILNLDYLTNHVL